MTALVADKGKDMVMETHNADAGPAGMHGVTTTRRHLGGWGLRLIAVIGAVLGLVFAGMGQAVAHQPGNVKPSATMPGGRQ